MELYDAIYKRRIVRDFSDKIVPDNILEKIINAGLQAPTHDHLRNWEFVILQSGKDKENALQFIKNGVKPQLKILKKFSLTELRSKKCTRLQCPDSIQCYTMPPILFYRFLNRIPEY